MPASLYPTSASLGGHLDLIMSSSASENNTSNFDDSRAAAEQIALQLALLQQQSGGPHETNGHGGHHAHNAAFQAILYSILCVILTWPYNSHIHILFKVLSI